MTKRILFINLFGLLGLVFCSANWPFEPFGAQGKKPSQSLKRFAERQRDLQESFDRDVSDGKAQFYEWESYSEKLRQFAVSEITGFKITDWKDNELLALASLYQQAEMFDKAAEAYRAHLRSETRPRAIVNVKIALARTLIESDRYEEAQQVMDQLFREMPENSAELSLRTGIYKDLAAAWRDRGKFDLALKQSRRGYDLADNTGKLQRYDQRLPETTGRDQMSLAAIVVVSQERLGFNKEAEEFHSKVLKRDFKSQPDLKVFYQSELMAERLLGKPAPDFEVSHWLGEARKLSDLRGKVVLLDFWAMWCGPCIGAFPHWRELQSKFGGKGFEIVGLTRLYGRSETEDGLPRDQELKSLQSFKDTHKLTYPIAVGKMDDVTNEERYGILGPPTVILIDRSGNVRHIKRGVGEYRKLEKRIELLVSEN